MPAKRHTDRFSDWLKEASRERQKEGQRSGGRGKKKLGGIRSPEFPEGGPVRVLRAKEAGTNEKYINWADAVEADAGFRGWNDLRNEKSVEAKKRLKTGTVAEIIR